MSGKAFPQAVAAGADPTAVPGGRMSLGGAMARDRDGRFDTDSGAAGGGAGLRWPGLRAGGPVGDGRPARAPDAPPDARPDAPPVGRKVLAVSSGGGHWVELRRLEAAFAGLDVVYASTDPSSAAACGAGGRHHLIRNVTRRDRWGFAVLVWQLLRILARERPDVVVTTGAAPGLVALALAKLLFGSRTIWIDSIASAARLSLSARLARPVADAWLVQWAHLARAEGPQFWGAVL